MSTSRFQNLLSRQWQTGGRLREGRPFPGPVGFDVLAYVGMEPWGISRPSLDNAYNLYRQGQGQWERVVEVNAVNTDPQANAC